MQKWFWMLLILRKRFVKNLGTACETDDEAYRSNNVNISVGFNRRFAPLAKMKELIGDVNSPINVVATMNAGFIPKDVWVHDMKVGGRKLGKLVIILTCVPTNSLSEGYLY